MGNPACEEVTEGIRASHRAEITFAGKDVPIVLPKTEMQMAARPGLVRGELRHEGHAYPGLLRDFLQALFEDDVPICHGEHVGVAHIQLMLSQTPFSLGAFNRNARLLQMAPHRSMKRLA